MAAERVTLAQIDGQGYVRGPAGSTDNAAVRWDGATGRLVQNSGITIDDSDNMSGVALLTTTANAGFGSTTVNWQGTSARVVSIVGTGGATNENGRLELVNPKSPAASGDQPGSVAFIHGSNGSTVAHRIVADVRTQIDGSGGTNGFGGRLIFATKGDNLNQASQPKMAIDGAGNVSIGASTTTYASRLTVTGGDVSLSGIPGAEALRTVPVTSAVNRVEVRGATAGNAPGLTAAGSDTDIDLALTPKGTGRVRFGSHTAIGTETVTGYITIRDSGGTERKLAVVS